MAPNRQPLTPLAFLERSGRVFPSQTAIVDHDTRFTYRDFLSRARSLAAGLEAAGIKPGDRVAFLTTNGEPLLTAHFGVPMSGGVLVALNTRLARRDILFVLNHARAAALFVDPALLTDLRQLRSECPELQTVITLGTEYDNFLTHGAGRQPGYEPQEEDDFAELQRNNGAFDGSDVRSPRRISERVGQRD